MCADQSNPPSPTPPRKPLGGLQTVVTAMELPFVLVASVLAGGAIGYFLDLKLHTAPWLLLILGLLGFLVGVRELLRRLNVRPKDKESQGNKNG